jgi:hypothetical protein
VCPVLFTGMTQASFLALGAFFSLFSFLFSRNHSHPHPIGDAERGAPGTAASIQSKMSWFNTRLFASFIRGTALATRNGESEFGPVVLPVVDP